MKLFNKTWKILILLLPFCEPRCFLYFSTIDTIFAILKMVSILLILLYIIKNFQKFKIPKCLFALILYRIVLLISTIKNGLEINTWLSTTIIIIFFALILEISLKENSKCTLQAFMILLAGQIFINLITWNITFAYATDGSIIHFVGSRTRVPDVAMPLIAISMIYSEFVRNKVGKNTVLIIGICVISFLIGWISTALLGFAVFVILNFLTYKKKLSKNINYKVLSISALLINVGVIFFRIQNYFSFIIENILGKKISLTGRTYVWDLAIEIIKESPIIGHGISENGSFVNFYGLMLQGHSQLIQTLYEGGIIAVIFLVLAIIYCGKKLMKYKGNPIATIITNMLFTIFIMMIAERYANYVYFYSLLIIGANINYIIDEKEKNDKIRKEKEHEEQSFYNCSDISIGKDDKKMFR